MMWMTTSWMGYALSVKPYEDPAMNVLEVVNELFYYLILLLCFTFTELLPDVGAKTETGFVFIALVLTMLVINIGVQIKDTIKLAILRLKKNWMLY
jgi:succinate-acetate transporter protein